LGSPSIRLDSETKRDQAHHSAIGFGLDLAKAFNQAKAALMLEGIPEENIPALSTNEHEQPDEIVLVGPLEF